MSKQRLPYEKPDVSILSSDSPEYRELMELLRAEHPDILSLHDSTQADGQPPSSDTYDTQ